MDLLTDPITQAASDWQKNLMNGFQNVKKNLNLQDVFTICLCKL